MSKFRTRLWTAAPLTLAALLGAVGASTNPIPVIAAIFLIIAAVSIFILRIDLASLVIVTTPVMFYANLGSRVKLSFT